jgi:tetratricopeptide (TPR) repeat protein
MAAAQLPGFRLGALLRRGGLGDVFAAEAVAPAGAPGAVAVAVEWLPAAPDLSEADTAKRLERLRALSQPDHPAVVRVREVVAVGGDTALILERPAGRDLACLLEERGALPDEGVALELVLQVLDVLVEGHGLAAAGISRTAQVRVHGALGPGSILVDETGTVGLLDYGVGAAAGQAGSTVHDDLAAVVEIIRELVSAPSPGLAAILTAPPGDAGRLRAALLARVGTERTQGRDRLGRWACAADATRTTGGTSETVELGEPPPVAPLPTEEPGTRLGRYLLLERIGEGGMGVVYAAYDPELDRRVALKLLHGKRGQTEGAQSRLLREAQAIARISHPNVVSIFDVGTVGGRIFLAMEMVEGSTLDEWLLAAPRERDEILHVFQEAGRGLAAAHAAGLVHRDFKPENVLIARDGRVRVSDFGLARVANPTSEAAWVEEGASGHKLAPNLLEAAVTQVGSVVGTPAYMAPEQLGRSAPEPRADQFSFCVTLYEALYQRRPFERGEIEAAVQSLLAPKAGECRGSVQSGRPLAPHEPPRDSRVPGWILRVLQRGLSLQPQDRYPTMDLLLADLRRDPAVARRRRLGWVGAAIALAGTLLAFRQVAYRREKLCRGAESRLVGVWDGPVKAAIERSFRASGRSHAAMTWERLQTALDGYARDLVAMSTDACEATRVRGDQSDEILSLRTLCLGQAQGELKALTGVFQQADSGVVDRALQAAAGLPRIKQCGEVEALRAPVKPPDPRLRGQVERLRAQLAEARTQLRAGRPARGLALASSATAAARDLAYEPLLAESLELLGRLQMETGDTRGSESSLKQAGWLAQSIHHDAVAARAWTTLIGLVGYYGGRHEQAHDWSRFAEASLRRIGGDDEIDAERLSLEADVYRLENNAARTLENAEKALAAAHRAFADDPLMIAHYEEGLASALVVQGRLDEGLARELQALATYQATLGPDHPALADALHQVGWIDAKQGRFDEALAQYQRALTIRVHTYGPDHPSVMINEDIIGRTLNRQGRYQEALPHSRRSLAIMAEKLGPDNVGAVLPLMEVGRALVALGRPEEAISSLERALALQEKDRTLRPERQPEVQFLLAEALWAAHRDRPRARHLAESAARSYAEAASSSSLPARREVEAWLAAHR